jgi:hypothetical protein
MKVIGGNRPKPVREQFTLKYLDANENEQEAVFQVLPRVSGGDIAGIMQAIRIEPGESVGRLIRLLSKVMDNRDGTVTSDWKPDVLPRKEDDERPPSFRGPDGEIYPLSDTTALELFADQETWTSRRRWKYLLEEDDDAIVELPDIQETAEWVIGLATDRPTQPPH